MNAETSHTVTRCPKCGTAFRVTPSQLSAAKGAVRCGSCLTVFKALEKTLQDSVDSDHELSTTKPVLDSASSADTQTLATRTPNHKPDREPLFGVEEDVYDIANQTKRGASLFERKPKGDQKRPGESADESWAVDLLAELEDDDIKPIVIKRKPKVDVDGASNSNIEPAPTADNSPPKKQPELKSQPPKKPVPDKIAPSEPPLEELVFNYDPLKTDTGDDFLDDIDGFEAIQAAPTDETLLDDTPGEMVDLISLDAIDKALAQEPSYAEDQDYTRTINSDPLDRWRHNSTRQRTWLWALGAVTASMLIVAQVMFYKFEALNKTEPYRQVYEVLCPIAGCQLPPLSAIAKIRASNLVVRSHPNEENALIIDTMLLNNAEFPQVFPALFLEFTNITGKSVAARTFQPGEYLGGELAGQALIPSNQPVHISIELVDPGEHAVNYRIQVVPAK